MLETLFKLAADCYTVCLFLKSWEYSGVFPRTVDVVATL